MTTRDRIIALLLIVLALVPSISTAKAKPPQDVDNAFAVDPASVLDDVEEGWATGNADLILRHFGTTKVSIAIDGSGQAGTYSKDQGYYLFKELFKSTQTAKFVFIQIRNTSDETTSTFAIAERRYLRHDDGRLIKDKVYVSLHLERGADAGRWVLDEIKSIR